VQADARVGYDSATSLYPLLAAEAKKMGSLWMTRPRRRAA